ncbi:MAG: DNA polymerase I, partial [Simkaniaceae bacterium]|nr:DNA polymerase I [Simkaniaceae bacterium]
MKKLYIVDALNYLFRSYFAIRNMATPSGKSTNALYGFIRSMQKLIQDFSAENIVVVFDAPDNKKSRLELYKDYKGHRSGMPEDLFPQIEFAYQFCEYEGLPHLTMPGVEADDTIASIARWAESKGVEVYICSSDKDLCQLVSKHINIINTSKNNLLIDRKKVQEIYGVYPEQINDYLAIVGDASDNVPGIEGFGPKTAASLLSELGDLETILKNPDKVKGAKKQETLKNSIKKAELSKKLTALDETLDIPQKETFYQMQKSDNQALCHFYQEMHFSSLLKSLSDMVPIETQKKETMTELVVDEASLKSLIQQLSTQKEVCIDTETTELNPMQAKLVGIGFGIHSGKSWYVPTNGNIKLDHVLRSIKPLLESKTVGFFGHHLKYDMHILLNHDIKLTNICFDTMLASYLLAPQNNRHNLDQLTLQHFNRHKTSIESLIGKGKSQKSMLDVPIEKVAAYCGEDVTDTIMLKELFEKELKSQKLEKILIDIELPLIPVLIRMERNGIFIDLEKLKIMSTQLTQALKKLESEIHAFAGKSFNIKSPKQLSEILYDDLNLQSGKIKKTTRADVLESIQDQHPIIEKILSYRALEKLRS